MKILIVGLVKNKQLKRIQDEGSKRGHDIQGCYSAELTVYADSKTFEPTLRGKRMDDYDLIYLWTVGKRRWEWNVAVDYLNKKYGSIIVNKVVIDPRENYSPTPLLSYIKQYENKLPFTASATIFSENSVDSVIDKFKAPYVIKFSTGHQGKGVFKADTVEELKVIIKDHKDDTPAFIVREFIPNDGDVRVFCVGYQAIGAMKRTAKDENEFRSNISLGGRGSEYDLKKYPKVQILAEKAAEVTGIEIAGVDIIIHKDTGESYILEVNPGPQFTGLEKYTKTNAASEIIKYFEQLQKVQKEDSSN